MTHVLGVGCQVTHLIKPEERGLGIVVEDHRVNERWSVVQWQNGLTLLEMKGHLMKCGYQTEAAGEQ